jgi:hypothetical protein
MKVPFKKENTFANIFASIKSYYTDLKKLSEYKRLPGHGLFISSLIASHSSAEPDRLTQYPIKTQV